MTRNKNHFKIVAMKNLFIILLALYANVLFAQKQNDNWINGNRLWNFNNSTNGNFTDSSISIGNTFKQSVSNVSDRNTGSLLFYTNGITVYNKNFSLMENGNDLFGPNTTANMYEGNTSAQGSLIIPYPGNSDKYYVFSLNTGYGLRYAIVDMTYNSGLGKVISKNTILSNSTNVNSMTSCISNDGGYWLVTQNSAGNFLSYKITATGISSPVISNQTYAIATAGLKISPNTQYLLDIWARHLYYFNNNTGTMSHFTYINNFSNSVNNPSSADFSEDSNVVYYISTVEYFCCSPDTYLCKHNISTGESTSDRIGLTSFRLYKAGLQRHSSGKIFIKQYDTFGQEINGFYKITNTNSTALNFNNVQYISNSNSNQGYTFPQLVEYPPTCINTLNIDQNITANVNYKASNQITASSIINSNLIVNYAAGNEVRLLPGFQVSGNSTGIFRAYIEECNPYGLVSKTANRDNPIIVENFNNLKIYPNPVSDILTIDSGKEKLISWELYDYSEKMIKNGNSNTINVQSVPNATYVLKINLEKKQISKTIIVKH